MRGTKATAVRKVLLSDREQKALAWLLSATDNGDIIAGRELPNVMVLGAVARRLGKPRATPPAQAAP